MHRDVHQVVAGRVKAPHRKLEPIGRVSDRPVIEIASGRPDLDQPAGLDDRIVQQVVVVVPKESALPGRLINKENYDYQSGRKEPVPRAKRRRDRGVFSVA